MAQFDVHRNPDPATRTLYPYLLDLQSDVLERMVTRVVAPLIVAAEAGVPAARLNPTFEVEGTSVVLSTQELAGVARNVLGEVVASLAAHRREIIAALDLLFTGA